jgi:hypothetical protein
MLTLCVAAQISIVQNLTYFEHLSEPMAEFLHILAEQYDYPQLADEILRELSNKEFNSNDTKGPKSVSTFMVRLSELAPRLVIKQVTLMAKQLDSEVCPPGCCCRGQADTASHTHFGARSSKSLVTCLPTSANRTSGARTTRPK